MPEEQKKYETPERPLKICPLYQEFCKEDRCAWWVKHWAGTEHEYSECAIATLAMLNDIALQ